MRAKSSCRFGPTWDRRRRASLVLVAAALSVFTVAQTAHARRGKKVRVLWGINGDGRGHASISKAVLPWFASPKYEVMLLAGEDAHPLLADFARDYQMPLYQVPAFRHVRRPSGVRSVMRSLCHRNTLRFLWLKLGPKPGRALSSDALRAVRDFRPQVIVNDTLVEAGVYGRRHKIPMVNFDGFFALAHENWPLPDGIDPAEANLLRFGGYAAAFGGAERTLSYALYRRVPENGAVKNVGPLVRQEVRGSSPEKGSHLLVYTSKPEDYTDSLHNAVMALKHPTVVYGSGRPPRRESNNVEFKESGREFDRDQRSARAVVATAGYGSICDTLSLGHPLALLPQPTVEQRLNALEVARWGFAMVIDRDDVSPDALHSLLDGSHGLSDSRSNGWGDQSLSTSRALRKAVDEVALPD